MVPTADTLTGVQRPAGRPWIIAHRGASRAHGENTLDAFRAARVMGADAVELDVRRTADGALVVHHDQAIEGIGAIVDHPLERLRRDAPWVPTFEEAMRACHGMWVNVEIKNSPFEGDFDSDDAVLAAVLGVTGPESLISSFNPVTMERALARASTQRTGFLVIEGVDPLTMLDAAKGHDTFHVTGLDGSNAREVLEGAAAGRLDVIAWTVDDPAKMRTLAEAGVAGIITNVPDVAVEVLAS